jgi:nitrate/nitrite transporter NarK
MRFLVGSNSCGASLSPLKSTLRAEIPGLTNARYGAISSSASLINAVLPILSGIVIDYYGPTYASVVCSIFILVGSIVLGIGGQKASFGT